MTNNDTATEIELTYAREDDARTARRKLINEGRAVTLIGYDGSRDVYAFGLYC